MDYIIEYDYDADENDELTIRKGDIVSKVKVHEDGWMIGVLRGKEGVFPSNFGKPLKDDRKKSQDVVPNPEDEVVPEDNKNNINNANEDDISTDQSRQPKKVTGVGFGNIFSGGKIQLKQTNNHKETKLKVTESVEANVEEAKLDTSLERKPGKLKEMARVLHSYAADNPDELSLEEGDIITVLDKENEDDGWWQGKLSNGQIGVFPENFVELIRSAPEEGTKPLRPNNVTSAKGPPPVLAAKPQVLTPKPTPPRPPQLLDTKSTPAKPTARNIGLDKDDGISFDAPLNHKPLVGPNAGRAKRPGKKLPTNVNVTSINTNDEDRNVTTPKSHTKENSLFGEKSPDVTIISRQKSKDNTISMENPPDVSISKIKLKETIQIEKVSEKTPEISISKPKYKEQAPTFAENNVERTIEKQKPKENTVLPIDRTQEGGDSKSTSLTKSKSLMNAELSSKYSGDFKDEISTLQVKVSNLQLENTELRNELIELRKSSTDQINLLQKKLNKLINEFDEEKAKRVATDASVSRLKENVEDLEVTMLSRVHK